jgi:plastocyanin
MKVVSKVSFFPSNPVEGGYYYNTTASTLGVYKDGNWSFNYPLVESGKKEGDLAFDINGWYPLYFTEDEAKDASSSSSAHSHEIDGVTYYMPDGGTEGEDFFHGTFGDTYYWYQKQGPLPSWITPPAQGATVTQALEQLVNPDTGETYTVPTGGYTVNVIAADPTFVDNAPAPPDPVVVDTPDPVYTNPYDYVFDFLNANDISDYGQNTYLAYLIEGEDKNGNVSGFTSELNPQTLELNVGDKVYFRMSYGYNRALDNHPVIINYGNSLSKEVTVDNQSYAYSIIQFNEVGTFTYSCKNHSTMMGYINVS